MYTSRKIKTSSLFYSKGIAYTLFFSFSLTSMRAMEVVDTKFVDWSFQQGLIASASETSIYLWNKKGEYLGTPDSEISQKQGKVSALEFSNNGCWLLCGNEDGTIYLWDLMAPQAKNGAKSENRQPPLYRRVKYVFNEPIEEVHWSKNDHYIASSHKKGIIRIFTSPKGERNLVLGYLRKHHFSNFPNITGKIFDYVMKPDHNKEPLKIFSIDFNKEEISNIAWSPGSKPLLGYGIFSADGQVGIWDMDRNKKYMAKGNHEREVKYVRWSLSGQDDFLYLISASLDTSICIWNANDLNHFNKKYEMSHRKQLYQEEEKKEEDDKEKKTTISILSASISHDNRYLVSCDSEGAACIWNSMRGAHVHTLKKEGRRIRFVLCAPNSMLFAGILASVIVPEIPDDNIDEDTDDDDDNIQEDIYIWDITSPQHTPMLLPHKHKINDMGWDPTGRLLVTACSDGLRIWNMENGEPIICRRP